MKRVDSAIFLHRIPYSGSSLITTFYTAEEGLQQFLFQGGKKKSSALFPMSICEITYYKRRESNLAKLTEAVPKRTLLGLTSNPIKSTVAFFLADVVQQTLTTNEQEKRVFHFLQEEILRLNSSEKVSFFPLTFLSKFTAPLGFFPLLEEENPLYFSIKEGEFHSDYRLEHVSISGDNCAGLLQLFKGEECTQGNKDELLEILLLYYKTHIANFNVENSLSIVKEVLLV